MSTAARWAQARRILCVRLDNVGDVIMTTPALRALRESAPGRHLTLLTSRAAARAAPLLSDLVDEVISFDAPWVQQARCDDENALILRLAEGRYDAAAIFTVFTQSALPAAFALRLAGIPLRLAHCRENPYHLLTDWVRETDAMPSPRHEVQRQLDLVAQVGACTRDARLSVRLRPSDYLGFVAAAARVQLDLTRRWALIHPGATAESRRYPAESFARVARRLHQEGLDVVFGGGPLEHALVEAIRAQAQVPSRSLCGALQLGEYSAAIHGTHVLITCNSAPAHLAAALQTPVVVPYALTNPQHTPWQVPSRVLYRDVPCRNCLRSVCPEQHHACLRELPADTVAEAALSLLSRPPRPSPHPERLRA